MVYFTQEVAMQLLYVTLLNATTALATAESTFRIALGLLLVTNFTIRLYFQKKVRTVERVEGRYQSREKFFYNLVLVSCLLMFVYVLSPWLDFAHLPLPAWLRWLGASILVSSSCLFWWTHRTLGVYWSGVLDLAKEHQLVTAGPYHRVRHPMYTAFYVLGIGVLLTSANWLVGLLNLGAVTWMCLVRIPDEEQMMVDRFGDHYRQYMAKTGRLLPRFDR